MNRKTRKIVSNTIVVIVILIVFAGVCTRFFHFGTVEYTDNAQVRQHIVPVNSRIQGFVKNVYFDEYQQVHKGDTLVLIEEAEFVLRLAQAEADYQNAISGKHIVSTGVSTTQNNVAVSDASLQEAKILLDNAERDYKRFKNLLEQDAVTRQQYDKMETAYLAAKARYELLSRQKKSASLVTLEQTRRLEQTEAGIKLAEAALSLARLNLSYTVIIAPCDGITGRKNIQEGQLVQPGQTLLNVIDENDKWIVANYKETQTLHIAPDYVVDIQVDALPDITFKGVVRSVSQATGASLSLLPQDNSAGNFVKVEQRIPVKIEFTKDNDPRDLRRLRAGMNVQCFVNY
ncbi:HlyD family secretion protein [Butyricimonas synergistica]|uniref:HlyD family secretion protein n=1 Tax=Butyricimonas synergistica TaxID=544644 RepID=UPI00036B561E|nr:HlyD family secretion protein [Butyricimonas synergistica]